MNVIFSEMHKDLVLTGINFIMKDLRAIHNIVQYNECIRNRLSEICQPIFNGFGFTSFGYTRLQKNGNRIILETNRDWLNYYSNIAFEEKKEGTNSLISNLENLIVNPTAEEFHIQMFVGSPKTKIQEQLCVLKVWNSVSCYINSKEYIEIYHLSKATGDNEAIIDLCVNKKFLLLRFLHYFRDKLGLLDIGNAPCVRDANLSKVFIQNGARNKRSIDHNVDNYIKQTHTDKFYLKTHDIFISRREAECLNLLSLGKIGKEIASHLNLSSRTVESYINSLKYKTNNYAKGALVKLAYENLLGSPYLFDN